MSLIAVKNRLKQPRVFRNSVSSFRWVPYTVLMNAALFFFVLSFTLLAINSGRNSFELTQIWHAVFSPQNGDFISTIIWEVRLPRVVTAVFAGAALGISGAIFQSISRNPLGSPDIIGFTTGAASGAIVYLIFIGESNLGIAVSAMLGGIVTAVFVYVLSLKFGTIGSYRLVLIGIGVGATLAALNGLLLVKGDINAAASANVWLAGSLNARQWEQAVPLAVGVMVLLPAILQASHKLSLIEMGDELAQQLGVNVHRTRLLLTFYAVILASLATAAAGPIAFIALAAPQLASRVVGGKGVPVLSAALMGALLLVGADWLSLTLPFNMAMPIGLMTAFIGGLYLLWVVTKLK